MSLRPKQSQVSIGGTLPRCASRNDNIDRAGGCMRPGFDREASIKGFATELQEGICRLNFYPKILSISPADPFHGPGISCFMEVTIAAHRHAVSAFTVSRMAM